MRDWWLKHHRDIGFFVSLWVLVAAHTIDPYWLRLIFTAFAAFAIGWFRDTKDIA